MAPSKPLKDRLFGAAVLKVSFLLRGGPDSPAFQGIYPGVLEDLGLTDAQVEEFLAQNREAVEKAARGAGAAGEP